MIAPIFARRFYLTRLQLNSGVRLHPITTRMKVWNCGVLTIVWAIGAIWPTRTTEAQTRTSVALDAAVGSGRGKGGEFVDRQLVGARLGVSVRRWQTSRWGVFIEGSMDGLDLTTGHKLSCLLNSRGGCVPWFPDFAGPTLVGGLAFARADRRFELRTGLGGASYTAADGPRIGAFVGQIDAAAFPVTHVGLVFGARWVAIPRYRGDRLGVLPWTLGLRIR